MNYRQIWCDCLRLKIESAYLCFIDAIWHNITGNIFDEKKMRCHNLWPTDPSIKPNFASKMALSWFCTQKCLLLSRFRPFSMFWYFCRCIETQTIEWMKYCEFSAVASILIWISKKKTHCDTDSYRHTIFCHAIDLLFSNISSFIFLLFTSSPYFVFQNILPFAQMFFVILWNMLQFCFVPFNSRNRFVCLFEYCKFSWLWVNMSTSNMNCFRLWWFFFRYFSHILLTTVCTQRRTSIFGKIT